MIKLVFVPKLKFFGETYMIFRGEIKIIIPNTPGMAKNTAR